ncbi:PA0069 family radical SAM protein [uncultured Aquabacterium sp.]|jgi:DNA repair photolyase|uniref:PA0069 family radical SAM protein n=1 Tax=uncultured Aquabacterium sp. TaxID=158753 RepID=UPI00260DF099|nr:PA0069 family radical SAM protein [uncultured Aquabacterium sp.]
MRKPAATPDAIPDDRRAAAPVKGRGTSTQLAHRFEARTRERDQTGWEPMQWQPAQRPEEGPADDPFDAPPSVQPTTCRPEPARTILSRNDSPDIPFTWAINPYRGCEHGCIYCYARPTHSYLNLSPGLDFETRLIAKVNAAEALQRELARPGYQPSPIQIGSATDAYQPVEREWRLTRRVLEVLEACRHPYTIVTKSSGVERDIDLLVRAADRKQVYVMVSITSLDAGLSLRLEPRAAAPWRRLETVRRLAAAGVPVGVNVAPIIPFLNEPEIERIIEAAAQAGAASIHYTVVRLPWEVNPLFQGWLADHVPDKAERIMARIRELHGGRDYEADFARRMKGEGIWADLIRQRVRKAAERHGLGHAGPGLDVTAFTPPAPRPAASPLLPPAQGSLF